MLMNAKEVLLEMFVMTTPNFEKFRRLWRLQAFLIDL